MNTARIIGLIALGSALCSHAQATIIGPAAGYSVFIFGSGSFVSQNTDTVGNVAVGGNTTLTYYTVAAGIVGDPTQSPNPAQLVVGGTLSANSGGVGSNQKGAIYTNNTPSLSGFTATGGVHPQTLVNFAAAASQYTALSAFLGTEADTGVVSAPTASNGETLGLTGTNAGLNVFTVAGSALTASGTITINAPSGSTVLINVTGTSATLSNGGVMETGIGDTSVLYNFYQATSVNLTGSKDPEGSVLAPLAGVTGGYGQMHGQLIAGSYSGNTQFDQVAFGGVLPTPVPIPPAAAVLVSGCLALAGFTCVRRRVVLPIAA